MKSLKLVLLAASTLLFLSLRLPEKKTSLSISFDSSFDKRKIKLLFDNGKAETVLKPAFRNGQVLIKEPYYSSYASIVVEYTSSDTDDIFKSRFFVDDAEATIEFSEGTEDDALENYSLENAYSEDEMGGDDLLGYTSEEQDEYYDFVEAVKDQMNDSLMRLLLEKENKLASKEMEYILLNRESYYSFWTFRKKGIYSQTIQSDSLLRILDLFPAEFKDTAEGEHIRFIIKGRSLRKGKAMPDFRATDVTGQEVSLSAYRGKYVILNFWASWCAPCLQEMPIITLARKKYPKDKLEVIYITQDTDKAAFQKAVARYNLQGVHLFSNRDLNDTYGVEGIPVVFLVDPDGKITYAREEEKDTNLKLLEKLLARLL